MLRSITITVLTVFLALTTSVCRADCFDQAAAYERVNPITLRGIAVVESSNNPRAINRNRNGSVDLGLMQVNSIHLPELNRYGIHKRDLMNACKNTYVAAWLLRKSMDRYGNTWKAVGGYHSNTPGEREQYALKVRKAIMVLTTEQRKFERRQAIQLFASN